VLKRLPGDEAAVKGKKVAKAAKTRSGSGEKRRNIRSDVSSKGAPMRKKKRSN